jgi:multidrug resistance efflux pump
MAKEQEEIELRGEELQEVLGTIPSWLLRWGITLVAVIVLILLGGSAIFRYPEVITSKVTLTGTTPTAGLIARSSGKLKRIYVQDKQSVLKGDYLAEIENPADIEDIFYLKQYLHSLNLKADTIIPLLPKENLNLGDIQTSYTMFSINLSEYVQFKTLNYYVKKIDFTKEKVHRYRCYYENMKRQVKLKEAQAGIAQKQYARDSILHQKELISDEEIENAYNEFLSGKLSLENMLSALENIQIQITEMDESLLDMEYQYVDKRQVLESQLRTQASQLLNEIQSWEMNYLFISPFNGCITFTKYWVENQNIISGEEVFNIVPSNQGTLIGKALLPINRSGKVKVGQKVNIRFENFPDAEFGIVKGCVKNISLVPSKEENSTQYVVEIGLPNGLTTTYGMTLPFLPEMEGKADIITDDLSVLERLILPIKNVLRNS